MPLRTLHLYCRVVDNFGDAGVCWRLARQLAREHALDVTLWIDRPEVLGRLVPELALDAAQDMPFPGAEQAMAWDAALAGVEPGTLNALPMLLHKLEEEAHRRKVRARLVALADSAEHPGGPERVAKLLGMAS